MDDDKMNQRTERERQDFNTRRGKRDTEASNQGDEQKGSEAKPDEDNIYLQSKTGNKFDN